MFSFLKSDRRAQKPHSENPLLPILTSVSSKESGSTKGGTSENVSHKYTELYDYFSEFYQMHAQKDGLPPRSLEEMYTSMIDKLKKIFTIKDLFDGTQEHTQNQKTAAQLFIIAYLNRGQARMTQRKHHEAMRDFSTLLDLDPTQAEARYQRSLIYSLNSKHQRALNFDIQILATTSYFCSFYRGPIKYAFSWADAKPTSTVLFKCNRYIQTPEGLFFFNKNTRELITITLTEAEKRQISELFDDNEETIEQLTEVQIRRLQQITKHIPPLPVEYEILYRNSYILSGTTLKYISTYGITEDISLYDMDLFLQQIDALFQNNQGNHIILSMNDIERIITANSGHYSDAQRVLSDHNVFLLREENARLENIRPFAVAGQSLIKVKPAAHVGEDPHVVVPFCESVFSARTEEPSLSRRSIHGWTSEPANSTHPDIDDSTTETISRMRK